MVSSKQMLPGPYATPQGLRDIYLSKFNSRTWVITVVWWRWFPYNTHTKKPRASILIVDTQKNQTTQDKKKCNTMKSWRSRIASVSRPERIRSLPSAFKPEASLKFCARIFFKPPNFQSIRWWGRLHWRGVPGPPPAPCLYIWNSTIRVQLDGEFG